MRRAIFGLLLWSTGALAQPANPPPSSLYHQSGTWDQPQTFGGPNASNYVMGLGSVQGTTASLTWHRYVGAAAQSRFSLQMTTAAEGTAGNTNGGSALALRTYTDTGTLRGTAYSINRASGAQGEGNPYFGVLAPWTQIDTRSVPYGSVYGNEINYTNGDKFAVSTLGANPITTQTSTQFVSFHWVGCCGAGGGAVPAGPLYVGAGQIAWVLISGASVVNGLDMNTQGLDATGAPGGGWYQVKANPSPDDFRVNALTNAGTGTLTGGGSAVTARPSTARPMFRELSYVTSGSPGYHLGNARVWTVDPEHYQPSSQVGGPAVFQMNFWQLACPRDSSRANNWACFLGEFDLMARNGPADPGYNFDLYGGQNPATGFYLATWGDTAGKRNGGTATNVSAHYVSARYRPTNSPTAKWVGNYIAFMSTPESLVGEGFDTWYCDPTTDCTQPANHVGKHGGVGADLAGAIAALTGYYTTHAGNSTVTLYSIPGQGVFTDLANGDIINLPQVHTYDGVTFGGGEYAISNISLANETVDITGTGTATLGGTYGAGLNFGEVAYIKRHTPFAWGQSRGAFQHALYINNQSLIRDGLAISSIPQTAYNPGGGLGWRDAAGNLATVKGVMNTAGNIDIVSKPLGTGKVIAGPFPTSCSGLATGTLANVGGIATFCP